MVADVALPLPVLRVGRGQRRALRRALWRVAVLLEEVVLREAEAVRWLVVEGLVSERLWWQ